MVFLDYPSLLLLCKITKNIFSALLYCKFPQDLIKYRGCKGYPATLVLQQKENYVVITNPIRSICFWWILPLSAVYILVVLTLECPKMSASRDISFSRL